MKLPIRLIPNTDPPRFKWTQQIETIAGLQEVEEEGTVPLALESALIELIQFTERQDRRVNGPDGLLQILADCSKKRRELEEQVAKLTQQPKLQPPAPITSPKPPDISLKKGKG